MVYLVGAGPGEPGLITVKGMELIRACDTIIYDRLGTYQLLEYTKPACRKIYVGKKAGSHYRSQAEINELLVCEGRKGNMVVRLKGGDPFVFGRGGEEVQALMGADIPFLVVPGVTSAVAVPEVCGIPVTHRGTARSFHVATAHLMSDGDLAHIQKEEGASVFLMGLSRLDRVTARLIEVGYDAHTPVAVISKGTMPGQKVVRADIDSVCERVAGEGLESPGLIVVGENAALDFTSNRLGPLQNVHVGLIGTPKLRAKMGAAVTNLGGRAHGIVDMRITETDEKERLHRALLDIESYSWLAFTSQNTIELFFKWIKEWGLDVRSLSHLKFAVVGAGTREALMREGYVADFVPKEYTTGALARGLLGVMREGERLLLPRAVQGSSSMLEILDAGGVSYDEIPVYDVQGTAMEGLKYLPDLDVLMFVSASGVRGFFEAVRREVSEGHLQQNVVDEKLANIRIAALGGVTEAALAREGYAADITPEIADVEHLAETVGQAFKSCGIE